MRGKLVPDLLPSEYIQRGATVLAGVLRVFAESRPINGRSWADVYVQRDHNNGVSGRTYSMDDPRFLLRVLYEQHRELGSFVGRAQANYAREIRETLNHVAHEPQNQTTDSAERVLSTMRLLVRPWQAEEADRELAALLRRLALDPHASADETTSTDRAQSAIDSEAADPFVPVQDDPDAIGDPAGDDDLEDGLRRVSLVKGDVTVAVTLRETISLALAENGVSPIVDISVENRSASDALVTDFSLTLRGANRSYADPRRISNIRVKADTLEELGRSQLHWELERAAFAELDEARSASVEVACSIDGTSRRGSVPVRLLARNEWTARSIPELLAAFVTPNANGIAELLLKTSDILEQDTGDPSIQGYQGDRERAVAIGRAVYDAIRARQIRYVPPPASFEDDGQKVRGATRVLEEGLGTCLDLVVLYCSALEQAGLNPIVVHVPGHAYAGFLTEDSQLSDVALDDRAMIHNLIHSQLFVGVELTLAAAGEDRPFDDAVAATRQWRAEGVDGNTTKRIEHLLDVRAAHRRIKPLSQMTVRGDVIEIQLENTAPPPVPYRARHLRSDSPVPQEPRRPPRVEKWRSALLDLSLRNPLLKLKKTSGVIVATSERSLPVLEDLVMQGAQITVRSGDDIDQIHVAQGKRTARQLDDRTLESILESEQAVYLDTTAARHDGVLDRLRRRRRVVMEETGASSLFLTLGALSWRDAKGSPALAPLFLLPMTVDGRKGRRYTMQAEPGAQVLPNYCLLEKLRRDGVTIPVLANPPSDESGIDLPGIFQQVRETLLEQQLHFSVEPHCRLALLQFSTLEMWRDLTENWQAFLANPVVHHLVHSPTETFVDPAAAPELVPADEVNAYLPLPVDGSQLTAVRWASAGRTFVLQGPPGTGKSQTITNIIADCLARGQRVMFVAEKQAALDVVRKRLNQVGLGPLCLDVHGRDQSIKGVRSQLEHALTLEGDGARAAYQATRDRVAAKIESLDNYAKRVHHEGRAGVSVWSARQQLLAHTPAPNTGSVHFQVPGQVVTGQVDMGAVYASARGLSHAMRQLEATEDVADWALVGPHADDDPAALRGTLARLDGAVRRTEASVVRLLAKVDHSEWRALESWLAHVDGGSAFTPDECQEAGGRRALDEADELEIDLERLHVRFAPTLELLSPQSEAIDTDRVRLDIRAADDHGFFGRKKAKAAIVESMRANVAPGAPIDYDGLPGLLDSIDRLREAESALLPRLRAMLGRAVTPYDPDVKSRLERHRRMIDIADKTSRKFPGVHPELAEVVESARNAPGTDFRSDLIEILHAWEEVSIAFGVTPETLSSWLAGRNLLTAISDSLPTWREHVDQGRMGRVQRIRRVATELERLEAHGFTDLAQKLREGELSAEDLESQIRHRVNSVILAERLEANDLDTFDAGRHMNDIATYRDGIHQLRDLLVDELPATVTRQRGAVLKSMGGLKREISRKRGGTIRELFRNYGDDVLKLTPCLLMSPHSVAKNLPHGSVNVDVVIFDEASQIRVADAVGAMGRARSVIIVGDSKQMPPTSMFATSMEEIDEDLDEAGEGAAQALAPADQESILSEAVDSNLQRLSLSWHYRSQAEELIAFSNAQYYQGRLATFPAPPGERQGLGVRLRRVDGDFERAGSRTNPEEAKAILDDILRRLSEDPRTSIGVVTFNAQQRALIEDELEAMNNPSIRAALTRDQDPLFVKNLENVQGDERDVILFSLAFSPDPETGRLRLNFGPLTVAGGERRLNVAITRARKEIVLFSSFDPRMIDLSRTGSEGMRHLREYLLFAEKGEHPAIATVGADHDLHREEVAERLKMAGLEVAEDLGMSSFRVDLAVRLPGREWIAVLLDGPRWAKRDIVADRDDIPASMLTSHMGWPSLVTVWTPAWIADADTVLRQIVELAENAPEVSPGARLSEQPALGSTSEAPISRSISEAAEAKPTGSEQEPIAARSSGESGTGPSGTGLVAMAPSYDEPSPTVHAPSPLIRERADAPRVERRTGGRNHESVGRGPHITKAPFEPASASVRHSVDVLNAIERTENKSLVRSELLDILDAEAPIQLERFMRIAGARFGLSRTSRGRVEQMLSQLPSGFVLRGRGEGAFCWSKNIDPAEYAYVRTSLGPLRSVEEIAPEELENAIRLALEGFVMREEDRVLRTAMSFFGFGRMGKTIQMALFGAILRLESRGLIRRRGETIGLAKN